VNREIDWSAELRKPPRKVLEDPAAEAEERVHRATIVRTALKHEQTVKAKREHQLALAEAESRRKLDMKKAKAHYESQRMKKNA